MDINMATVSGRLGRDPDMRYTQSGKVVVNFSIAINCGFGEHKKTLWLKCTAFGKTGELISNHFSKGDVIVVAGELSPSEWTDKDGNERKEIELHVPKFWFAPGKKKEEGSQSSSGGGGNHYAPHGQPSQHERQKVNGYQRERPAPQPPQDYDADDIPF